MSERDGQRERGGGRERSTHLHIHVYDGSDLRWESG